MARKIQWYVEHQEFNRAQEELIREQQDTITNLRLKVAEMESLVTKSGQPRTLSDKDRQIRSLQRRIADLEETLRNRYPNSIPELIRACRAPPEESAALKEAQVRISQLQKQLADEEQNAQHAIDRLRVESDSMKYRFQQKLEKVEEEMKTRLISTQSRKVKELEKQLQDSRKFYSDKIKEQEQLILSLRRQIAGAPQTSSTGGAKKGGGTGNQQQQPASGNREHIASQQQQSSSHQTEQQLEGRRNEVPAEQQQQQQQHSDPFNMAAYRGGQPGSDPTLSSLSPEAAQAMISTLQHSNRMLQMQVSQLSTQLSASPAPFSTMTSGTSNFLITDLQQQVQSLTQEITVYRRLLHESQENSRKAQMEGDDRSAKERADHHREIKKLQEEHSRELNEAATRYDRELRLLTQAQQQQQQFPPSAIHPEHAALQDIFSKLQHEGGGDRVLFDSNRGRKQAATLHEAELNRYLSLLTQRLEALQQRFVSKEVEFRRALEEAQRIAKMDLLMERQKMELVIEQKNQQIDKFRVQLDALLEDIAMLRAPGASAGKGESMMGDDG